MEEGLRSVREIVRRIEYGKLARKERDFVGEILITSKMKKQGESIIALR